MPKAGQTIKFGIDPADYREINKDGKYAKFSIPNMINALLGGSHQVEYTNGGMSVRAYINPETGMLDVELTDRTTWDLTSKE